MFLTSAKSNDITNIFEKYIHVQKSVYNSIFDITMSPDHFEIKNKDCVPYNGIKWAAIDCAFKFRL